MPPEQENKALTWPYWPIKMRTSSSHEEGCEREFSIATKEFIGENGKVTGLKTVRVEKQANGQYLELIGTEKFWPADLVLLAIGFSSPVASVLDSFGVTKSPRGCAQASEDEQGGYATNVPKVFAAGDMRRGQSLVVWAIREGRQAAQTIDEYLMGKTQLPRWELLALSVLCWLGAGSWELGAGSWELGARRWCWVLAEQTVAGRDASFEPIGTYSRRVCKPAATTAATEITETTNQQQYRATY